MSVQGVGGSAGSTSIVQDEVVRAQLLDTSTTDGRRLRRQAKLLDKLHLVSGVQLDQDADLIPHFIDHYTGLGVVSRRIHLVLHSASEERAERMKHVLIQAGAAKPWTWVGDFKPGGMWRRRVRLQAARLKFSDWVLVPEIDELQVYPNGLATTVDAAAKRGADWLSGALFDDALSKSNAAKALFFRASVIPNRDFTGIDAERTAAAAIETAQDRGYDLNDPTNSRVERLARAAKYRLLTLSAEDLERDAEASTLPERARLTHAVKLARWDAEAEAMGLSDPSRAVAVQDKPSDVVAALRQVSKQEAQVFAAPGWRVTQLTPGGFGAAWHSHSYYDIHSIDPDSKFAAAIRSTMPMRRNLATDTVEVGVVDLHRGGFEPLGTSNAWSWQQGPMAQFTPAGDLIWNDLEDARHVVRLSLLGTSAIRTYDRPAYAVTPDGQGYLSVCMARLYRVRPAYGYAGGTEACPDHPAPQDDGLWYVDFATGASRLVLPTAQAVAAVMRTMTKEEQFAFRRGTFVYWMNHVKISPNGKRFTLKLRWREPGKPFDGASITCNLDGSDLRVLSRATSHVMWYGDDHLFWWDLRGKQVVLGADIPFEEGIPPQPLAPGVFDLNPHARLVPGTLDQMFFDEPYNSTVKLFMVDLRTKAVESIAQFGGHLPPGGPFRCDLHPVPTPDGQRVLVTSLASGSRQLWIAERDTQS
ncbi:hypothetical protein [Shimia ponticola]|uniref:hypothetical protein n=1 Tax=Shimia ponticola TaxID=2582893 RepID=UPI0011BE8743|nr:hypothetical protein [Shimia ponticola]